MSAPHADRDHSEQPPSTATAGSDPTQGTSRAEAVRVVRASEAQVKAAMKALDCRRDEDECNTCYGSPWTDRGCEAAVAAADARWWRLARTPTR